MPVSASAARFLVVSVADAVGGAGGRRMVWLVVGEDEDGDGSPKLKPPKRGSGCWAGAVKVANIVEVVVVVVVEAGVGLSNVGIVWTGACVTVVVVVVVVSPCHSISPSIPVLVDASSSPPSVPELPPVSVVVVVVVAAASLASFSSPRRSEPSNTRAYPFSLLSASRSAGVWNRLMRESYKIGSVYDSVSESLFHIEKNAEKTYQQVHAQ